MRTHLLLIVLVLLVGGCDTGTRSDPPRPFCINNLKAIEGAKNTWALQNKKTDDDIPTDSDLFGVGRYMQSKPNCPAGGIYTIGRVGEKPRCSIQDHTL
jgi:hypothetical protein